MPTYRVPVERTDTGALTAAATPDGEYDLTYVEDSHTLIATTFEWEHDLAELVGDDPPVETDEPDGEEHVCDECGEAFDTPQGLASHSRVHQDDDDE